MKDNKPLRARIRRIALAIAEGRSIDGYGDRGLVWNILETVAERGLPEIGLLKESESPKRNANYQFAVALLYHTSLVLAEPAAGGLSARKDLLAGALNISRKTLDRALTAQGDIAQQHVTALSRQHQLPQLTVLCARLLQFDATGWLRDLAQGRRTKR